MRPLFALAAVFTFTLVAAAQDKAPKGLEGRWLGTLKTGVIDLRLVFHLTKKGDDWTGAMDSVDQGANDIPIETIDIKERDVKLTLKKIGGVYEGTLSEDGSEIVGKWKQGGGNLPLTLRARTSRSSSCGRSTRRSRTRTTSMKSRSRTRRPRSSSPAR